MRTPSFLAFAAILLLATCVACDIVLPSGRILSHTNHVQSNHPETSLLSRRSQSRRTLYSGSDDGAVVGQEPQAPSPAGSAPGGPASGSAPGGPASGSAPGGPPSGSAPGGPPSGSAPGGPPSGSAPGFPPSGSAPGGPPSGSAPGGPPSGSAPGGPPSGSAPGGKPFPPPGKPGPGGPALGPPGPPPRMEGGSGAGAGSGSGAGVHVDEAQQTLESEAAALGQAGSAALEAQLEQEVASLGEIYALSFGVANVEAFVSEDYSQIGDVDFKLNMNAPGVAMLSYNGAFNGGGNEDKWMYMGFSVAGDLVSEDDYGKYYVNGEQAGEYYCPAYLTQFAQLEEGAFDIKLEAKSPTDVALGDGGISAAKVYGAEMWSVDSTDWMFEFENKEGFVQMEDIAVDIDIPSDGVLFMTANGHVFAGDPDPSEGMYLYAGFSVDDFPPEMASDNKNLFQIYGQTPGPQWAQMGFTQMKEAAAGAHNVGLHGNTNAGSFYVAGTTLQVVHLPRAELFIKPNTDFAWSTTATDWTTLGDMVLEVTANEAGVLVMSANGHMKTETDGAGMFFRFSMAGGSVNPEGYGHFTSYGIVGNPEGWSPLSYTQFLNVGSAGTYTVTAEIKTEDVTEFNGVGMAVAFAPGSLACADVEDPENGSVSLNNPDNTYPTIATYSCADGFTLMNGDEHRTCGLDGAYDGTAPICVTTMCETLDDPADGEVITSNSNKFPSSATYTCNEDYDMTGSNTRSCQSDGTWDGEAPTCSRTKCETLFEPANGEVELTHDGFFPSIATYSCTDGYEVTGEPQRNCLDDGTWDGEAPTCEDIDECASNNGGCHELRECANTIGGHECGACPTGYTADENDDCIDDNECLEDNGGCHELTECVNTAGSFECGECPDGYTGTGDNNFCEDVNECLTANGGCSELTTCTNTDGGHICGPCPDGYTGDGETGCQDVDECQSGNGGCDAVQTCTNTVGSFQCGPCPDGYTTEEDGTCTDINECNDGNNGGCDAATMCVNTQGGRVCSNCPYGFEGDPDTGCEPIDLCATNNGGCDALVTCTRKVIDNENIAVCGECPSGYEGSGDEGCEDIDECAVNNGGCDELVTCTNTGGSRICGACPDGFAGSGVSCVSVSDGTDVDQSDITSAAHAAAVSASTATATEMMDWMKKRGLELDQEASEQEKTQRLEDLTKRVVDLNFRHTNAQDDLQDLSDLATHTRNTITMEDAKLKAEDIVQQGEDEATNIYSNYLLPNSHEIDVNTDTDIDVDITHGESDGDILDGVSNEQVAAIAEMVADDMANVFQGGEGEGDGDDEHSSDESDEKESEGDGDEAKSSKGKKDDSDSDSDDSDTDSTSDDKVNKKSSSSENESDGDEDTEEGDQLHSLVQTALANIVDHMDVNTAGLRANN